VFSAIQSDFVVRAGAQVYSKRLRSRRQAPIAADTMSPPRRSASCCFVYAESLIPYGHCFASIRHVAAAAMPLLLLPPLAILLLGAMPLLLLPLRCAAAIFFATMRYDAAHARLLMLPPLPAAIAATLR